jgi:Ca-activated chloride channel family protein
MFKIMEQPLLVSLTPHREFLPADSDKQKLFVMLKLKPAKVIANSRPSTAVILLIDTSGSMYEIVSGEPQATGETVFKDGNEYNIVTGGKNKMDLVIESLNKLIYADIFTAQDKLALIQFDDQASSLIGLTNPQETAAFEEAIAQLETFSGGTCMGRGLSLALEMLYQQKMSAKRILIFTDGQTFDELECQELAKNIADNGVRITALGIGDYNEDLLIKLSDSTAGSLYHLVGENATGTQISLQELPEILFNEIKEIQQEVINNIGLNIKTVKGVELTKITRVYPQQADITLTNPPYHLGNAQANDETIFILELDIEKRPSSKVRIAQIGLTYDIPGLNRRGEFPPENLVVQFISGGNGGVQVDPEVMGYVQQNNIATLVGNATNIAEANPEQAEKLLETARRLTVRIGNNAMLESLNNGIEELRRTRKISAGTRKTVKMGAKGKTIKMEQDINDEIDDEIIREFSGT